MAATRAEKGVHLDSVLQQLGSFGRYQLLTMALIAGPYILDAWCSTHYVFSVQNVDYRCRIEECDSNVQNATFDASWATFTVPDNSSQQCYRHARRAGGGAACAPDSFDRGLVACHEWVYQENTSFVAEFKLACQGWKRALVPTTSSAGNMAGILLAGQLSDRFGRKVMIYAQCWLLALVGLAKTFVTSYSLFIGVEFVDGMFTGGLYSVLFTYSIEQVNKEKRILYTSSVGAIYSIGAAFYAIIAWKVPYWRHLLRVIYASAILLCLHPFLMDESVRWLLSKGRKAEAMEIILKMAKTNSINISNETLKNLQYEEQGTSTEAKVSPFVETLRSRVMLRRLAICCVWWTTCLFMFYGMTLDSVTLGGDKYISFALSNLVEIPSTLACAVLLDRFGRKTCLWISFTITGVICVSRVFVPRPMVWLATALFLLGKLTSTFTFCAVYIYTSELFPTYTRNSMMAACSSVGRIGSIVAPQVSLLAQYWSNIPTVLYASCSLVSALLTLLTPDTRQAPLPDNVLQAENIHKHKNECIVTQM